MQPFGVKLAGQWTLPATPPLPRPEDQSAADWRARMLAVKTVGEFCFKRRGETLTPLCPRPLMVGWHGTSAHLSPSSLALPFSFSSSWGSRFKAREATCGKSPYLSGDRPSHGMLGSLGSLCPELNSWGQKVPLLCMGVGLGCVITPLLFLHRLLLPTSPFCLIVRILQ